MSNILDVCSSLRVGGRESFLVDFIGKGNIWIKNSYRWRASCLKLANYVISEALKKTAPGQLSVIGYDSDLSGVFAPFSSLSAGESKVLELIPDETGFENHLDYLWQQIVAVQNVIQGRYPSLLEFRKACGRPVEGYKLVVLSLDLGSVDSSIRAKITTLMRKGPENGISFVILSPTQLPIQTPDGETKYLDLHKAMEDNCPLLDVADGTVTNRSTKETVHFSPIDPDALISDCKAYMQAAKAAQLPTIRFDEIHDLQEAWQESSIDGLTFSIGMYGISRMDITIGDEINQRHNAIITGAVGQGKSNLISVIIHSLCQRYSPRELQLYLLDFKEGVTFKPFANIGQEEYLPHARALGLESDPSFGLAVLTALYHEYQRRMKLLKDHNLKSIRELRLRDKDVFMPRILVIIDEFQLMFDDPQTEQKIADLLEKSVRLFRAAGIHFILASQTLSDVSNVALSQKKESLFSQVPIRIALKNSLTESQQTLGINNPAAAFLRPREAVVNLDYGEVTQNRKTVIAFADEELLKRLRRVWWEGARSVCPPPYVFESDRRITVKNGISKLLSLREKAQRPMALLGERISVDGECISLPMTREDGRNIAIIGTPDAECNHAFGIMQSIAASLAAQHRKSGARFIFCDFTDGGTPFEKSFPQFASLLEAAGSPIESILPADFQNTLQSLREPDGEGREVYVFGAGMDRWEYEKDPYGQGSPLKEFVEKAPARGIHFIGWWQKASNFNAQISGFSGSDAFNTKVFLRVDERTVQSLTDPFVQWTAQPNRALISDAVELSEEVTFVPYAPVGQDDAAAFQEAGIWA